MEYVCLDKIMRGLEDFLGRNTRKCSVDVKMLLFQKSDKRCVFPVFTYNPYLSI